jgi:dTDP-glucose 4,6-dehydratase
MMKLLVTGSCGFIGSHLLRLLLQRDAIEHVTSLDALTYAANINNIVEFLKSPRHRFVRGSITDGKLIEALFASGKFDAVLNLAAESHVDRSIESATPFIQTNIMGTHLLLDAAQRHGVRRFVQISTDEVYGSLELDSSERFREDTPITPRSPYAASKAAADLLVLAAAHTHRQDVVITRCSNNYGPNQFPE